MENRAQENRARPNAQSKPSAPATNTAEGASPQADTALSDDALEQVAGGQTSHRAFKQATGNETVDTREPGNATPE